MKWGEIVSLSRNFRIVEGNRFARVMMLTGIVTLTLCISIMLVASYITKGFYKEISNKLFDFWGHIYVSGSFYDETYTTESMPIDLTLMDSIVNAEDEQGKKMISSCDPVILNSCIIQESEELEGILAKGVDDQYLQYFLSKYSSDPDSVSVQNSKRNLSVSKNIAEKLNLERGKSVILHFIREDDFVSRKFRVSSIYNTGMSELDDRMVLMSLDDLRSALGWDENEIGGYEIFVRDIDKLDQTDEILYNDVLPVNLFSTTIRDKYPATFDWLKMQKINQRLIFYMLLIVCIANLITLMLMLFMERIQFVGVMKTLGATAQDLRRFFLLVGGRILISSMILGNLIAFLFTVIQDRFHFFKLNEEDYFISYVPVSFDWNYFLQVNGFLLLFGVLSLFIPIAIMQRFQIIKILGFK